MGAYTLQIYNEKLRSIPSQYELSSANRLFVDSSLWVQPCMKTLFSEEIFKVNFKKNPKTCVERINNWVAEKTRRVIKNFLSSDQVTPSTELVLVSISNLLIQKEISTKFCLLRIVVRSSYKKLKIKSRHTCQ